MSPGELACALDRPLPTVVAGRPDVVLVAGRCEHPTQALRGLEVLVDGTPHAVEAWGMPRRDLPSGTGGFWALVAVHAHAPGTLDVAIRARLADGSVASAALGSLAVDRALLPGGTRSGTTIVVCMATFDPDPELLRVQVDSLRAQTDTDWRCVVCDDGSGPEGRLALDDVLGDDPRFSLHPATERRGFYRNFERALRLAGPDAALVALCDQDDRWHPDKLATLRAALGDAQLAYSDQRLTEPTGRVLRDTMWAGRANNHTDLTAMLVANTITGAATLFRGGLLDVLLPFPDPPGYQFHDHWLAITALATGRVAYVDRPLYDYVQHAGAVFGDVATGARRARPARRGPGAVLRAWRAAHFYGWLPRALQAQTVLARAPHIGRRERRALEAFVAAGRSPLGAARLALHGARHGRGPTATLGSERALAGGTAWRLLAGRAARTPRLRRGPLADAALPPLGDFDQPRLRRWRSEL